MRNPFRYGGVVTGEDFCNREREQNDLVTAVRNAEKLFLYAERRMGKTSLVRQALARLPEREYLPIYVDLLPTDSEGTFAAALARSVAEASGTTADRILSVAKRFFSHLAPSVTVSDDGKPAVEFGVRRSGETEPDLETTLEAPARLAAAEKIRVVVVYDEFQQILLYGSDRIERTIRSVVQHHDDVSYLFLGSRRHVIQGMFLDAAKPLYRSAGHYPLEPIGIDGWQPFITDRFRSAGKEISDAAVRRLVELTGGHPFYTQHLCHVVWERTAAGETAEPDALDPAVETLLHRESYAYTALWEGMTLNQQRLLKGLAAEPPGIAPFSSDFIESHGLKSPSNVQRASRSLMEQDIIDRDGGSFFIVDRFFRLWIRGLIGA